MMLPALFRGLLVAYLLGLAVGPVSADEEGFTGKIGTTVKDSIPSWPDRPEAPAGAPNIVIILLDDVGFADSSVTGGPVQMPALQKLADQGLLYNRFHTTALCSPTRASLLTGRNHHRTGFGTIDGFSKGYPGYNAIWKKSTASIAEVLRQNGYSTAAFGKWHNTPLYEVTPVGPFDRWPTGLGFEYFYGFLAGADSQWEPALYRNTLAVEPPLTSEKGYHLTTDITNEAIWWLRTHKSLAPKKPYLLYFAPGAAHAPHHVPAEWIAAYRGRFDQGWDRLREENFARQKSLGVIPNDAKLTPRPAELPAWDSLNSEQKKLYARQMEVFAGFLAHTDHEVGRLLDAVQSEDTLVFYIVGDNGDDAFGGMDGTENEWAALNGIHSTVKEQMEFIDELGSPIHGNHYAGAWAWAGSTPFQWVKGVASHLGGIRNPMIVSWPGHIKDKGQIRSRFTHVNDVTPTILDVIGIKFPDAVNGGKQEPLDGRSFASTFEKLDQKEPSRTQYFEQWASRGIYHDGWFASARHSLPWVLGSDGDISADRWELYRLEDDFSQARDVAGLYPEKLEELKVLFDREARINNVYPLSKGLGAVGDQLPSFTAGQHEFVYYPDIPRLGMWAVPDFMGSHRIDVEVMIPGNKTADGLLVSSGARWGGFSLYMKNGVLIYECNFYKKKITKLSADITGLKGKAVLGYEFIRKDEGRGGGGIGKLYVNGKLASNMKIEKVPFPAGSFSIGQVRGSPVGDYKAPFPFSGEIQRVRVTLLEKEQ